MSTKRESIDRFLAGSRIAMVGVSRNPRSFANSVYRALRNDGYEMFPVNAFTDTIEHDTTFRSIGELPDVDGAIIMVSADDAADVVRECVERGIPRVWLHKGVGKGSVTSQAVQIARDAEIDVVDGACPLMFLEPTGFVHRLHRAISGAKITAEPGGR